MTRTPVVFEGTATAGPPGTAAEFREKTTTDNTRPLRLRVGSPMTPSASPDIEPRREGGANVLVVARTDDDNLADTGPLTLATLAATTGLLDGAGVDLIDWTSVDTDLEDRLAPLIATGLRFHRRRGASAVLADIAADIANRIRADDRDALRRLTILFGLHRARDLSTDISSLDVDTQLSDNLLTVIRDGPEVGVHTWAWVDSVAARARRLEPAATRQFAWRIAAQMSADDAAALLGTETAAALRANQLLAVNDDGGITRRYRTITCPDPTWITETLRPDTRSTP